MRFFPPGLAIQCWLTPPPRPRIRFLFVESDFCLQLPSNPASRRRPCSWLAIPTIRARRGLSPLRFAPCLAHIRNPLLIIKRGLKFFKAEDIFLQLDQVLGYYSLTLPPSAVLIFLCPCSIRFWRCNCFNNLAWGV